MADVLQFDHLVFDLDDTLLDTSRQLLPRASREACSSMIVAGLEATLDSALKAWDEHRSSQSRQEVFTFLVHRFGVREGSNQEAVAQRGFHAFYNRRVESDIHLFSGAREMLIALHSKYGLHLVTSGARSTQEEKIRLLGISQLFDSVGHVDPSRGQCKRDAFAKIMSETGRSPARYLSVGNRIDSDIAEARELGWKACWVRYGEHVDIEPMSEIEVPDFTVDKVVDVVEKCRL